MVMVHVTTTTCGDDDGTPFLSMYMAKSLILSQMRSLLSRSYFYRDRVQVGVHGTSV